ncbi:MAG TPA: sterol desaturase family protein [Polyangiaceae bacterium]|nr:sterol desaturase family protein [Polyangiaceae bacterium]
MRPGAFALSVDYAILPLFMLAAVWATSALLGRIPEFLVTGLVVGVLAVMAAVLERVRPERTEYTQLDQPLAVDAAHFFLNYHFGYALALGACAAVGAWLNHGARQPVWPSAWPLGLELALALLLAEGVSYWQHRMFHRVPWLWSFHALHHKGERLNLVRAGRFHFVDIGAAAFMALVPLVVLGAPDTMLTWVASISGALGVLEHANIRMRTPAWLAWVVCTPAVHRHHHSRVLRESNRNFGTSVMLFDVLFGTYEPPRPAGPVAVGVENDPLQRGFWNQVVSPFRRLPRGHEAP